MKRKLSADDVIPVVVGLISILIVAGVWGFAEYSSQVERRLRREQASFVELVETNQLRVEATGGGLSRVKLLVLNTSERRVRITLPPGTYFDATAEYSQDMVSVAPYEFVLAPHTSEQLDVEVVCATMFKGVPEIYTQFTVRGLADQPSVVRVAAMLADPEFSGEPYSVRQAAVWVVTDNASLHDLTTRIRIVAPSTPSLIEKTDVARAWRVLERAGIDLQEHRIWGDAKNSRRSCQLQVTSRRSQAHVNSSKMTASAKSRLTSSPPAAPRSALSSLANPRRSPSTTHCRAGCRRGGVAGGASRLRTRSRALTSPRAIGC